MSSTPADATPATADDARRLAAASFRPSRQRLIGADHVAEVADVVLPAGGTITIEPGSQLELVTRPFAGPQQLVAAMSRDIDALVERFSDDGLNLVSLGLDPIRPPHRSLDVARYEEMERFFAARSPAGRDMMTRTASLQPIAPTIADLERHITTLFPPLRPRGFIELRMLDALPAAGRTAAIATVWTLLTDPDSGASAAAQCESVDDPWGRALGAGLDDETARAVSEALVGIAASRMDDEAFDLADACREWRQGRDRTGPPWRTTAEVIAGSVEPRGDEM